MPKYFSGRVKRTPQSGLTSDRYQYLGLDQAEPNLGDPPEVDNIPTGQQYQIVSVQSHPGERFWIPLTGGIQPGSITVREQGNVLPNPSGVSSITDINFKGDIITAVGTLDDDGNPGTGVTITVAPVGNDHEVLFIDNGEFGAASGLSYDNTNHRVGIGSTQPQETLDIDGTLFITGNVFDKSHDSGDENQVLVRSATGGLVWADQSGATAVAAGKTTQVQFHNDDGNLGGAAKLVYDYTNNRIGIGSTQPTKLLDVLGDSKFTGTTDFDGNVNIDGVLTYEDVTNVDSIGVVTAGKGVRITSEGLIVVGVTTLATTRFPDDTSLYFGADDDLEIKHDGNDSIINDNATGSLKLQQGGNTRLEVTGAGVTVSGVTTTNFLSVTGFVTSHLIPSPASVGLFNLGSENNRWDYIYTNNIDTGSWSPIVVDTEQLWVSGLSTFLGLTRHQDGLVVTSGVSTFAGNVKVNTGNFVEILDNRDSTGSTVGALVVHGGVGISKLSNFGEGINVIGHTELDDVNISGIVTAAKLDVGISTLGIASATSLYVSGLSTFVGFSTFTTGVHVTGFSTFVGFSTFNDIIVGGMSTFVGISSFKGNVSFNAGIRDKDGDLGGIVDGAAVDGWLLESRNSKINWVNPQGLTVENATKIGVGSVYGGPPLTDAGIKTHFVTFVPDNNPIDDRQNELLYTTGLFVYDPIGQRVGIGTTIPSDTLSVTGITTFNGEVYFNSGVTGITSIGWNPSSSALEFRDDVKAVFGNDDDLQIYYDAVTTGQPSGGHSIISSGEKSLSIISGNTVEIEDENRNSLAEFHADGNVELYWNGTPATGESVGKKLETSGIGITVTGLTSTTELSVSGPFYDSNNSYGASSGYILETNQASGVSWVNPTDLAFGKANKIGIGSINAADAGIGTHFITFVDTNNHPGRDYELLYSTGLFVYDPQDGGRVGIGTTIPSDTLSVAGISSFNGEVYFNSGVTGITSIGWNPSNSALEFKDNVKATFGDGNDLQIYHDTNDTEPNSVIEHNNPAASALYLSSNQRVEITDENHTNLSLRFNNTGDYGTELFHAINKKFETSGVGVTVYGSISIYDSDDSNKITLQPPATENLIADYALTLPVDDGGPNEVLTTDGSGVLSWTTKASGTAVAAGDDKQVQFNDNNVIEGAENLLFNKSDTSPTLVLSPKTPASASTNGGYIQVRNAGSTNTTLNASTINSDGGLELKRTNETVTDGGPYVDFKYDADDMDARIQMDIVSGDTSDAKFSAIRFSTGGGGQYDAATNSTGRLTEKLRIGKDGEIGIQGGAQVYDASSDTVSTNHRTSAQIYGTQGQVLKSNGLGASVYWDNEGTGSGISAVDVKQYSDDLSQSDPRTVRSCDTLDAPITVSTNSGTAVIGIGSTSNAYGNRYIGDTEPTGNLCDGDIWYDTSSAGSGGVNGSTGITRIALIKDVKNYDVNGGGFAKDGWRDRDLTEIEDPQGFVNFNSNGGTKTTTSTGLKPGYWSLQPGTYKIEWSAPAFEINRHQTKLVYSTTEAQISEAGLHASASSVEGSTENTTWGSISQVPTQTRSFGSKVIKITDRTWFKIMHFCTEDAAANNTNSFGRRLGGANDGNPDNIYTEVRIEDLATAVKEVDIVNTGITKVATVKDVKAYNGNGGSIAATTWTQRDLNTPSDPKNIGVTVTDNKIRVPAGTYSFRWTAPAYYVGTHQTKLEYSINSDFSAAVTTIMGSSEFVAADDPGTSNCQTFSTGILPSVTFTQDTYVRILHFTQLASSHGGASKTNIGLGVPTGNAAAGDSIYTQVFIEDLATAVKEVDVVTNAITKVAKVEEIGSYGNSGAGTFNGNQWITRSLTNVTDPKGIGITLNTTDNYITVPAGTYSIKWSAPAMMVDRHVARLLYSTSPTFSFNSAATTDVYGEVAYTEYESQFDGKNSYVQTRSTGFLPSVTFTGPTYIKVQHLSDRGNTDSGDAMGVSSPWSSAVANESSPPIWTTIEIEDLSTAVKEPTGSDVPVGGIIMYHGTETELNALTNWKLCDGTVYGSVTTPNLKDKFVIGADSWSTADAGKWETNVTGSGTQSGGNKNAVLPAHNHSQSILNGSSGTDAYVRPGNVQSDEGVPLGSSSVNTTGIDAAGNASSTQTGTNANLPPYYALAYIMRIS